MAKSKSQKAMASGPSSIGSKARAAANKLKEAKNRISNGRHASQVDSDSKKTTTLATGKHAKTLSGKHHAPSAQGAVKNAYGSIDAPSKGKHSRENPNSTISKLSQSEAMSYRRKYQKKQLGKAS